MIISVEADAPTRSDRRTSWIVGGLVAAIFAWMIVAALTNDGPAPVPNPPPEQSTVALSSAQATYLVYTSWLDSAAFSQCMTSRGFSREPVAGTEHSRVLAVAEYLGIVPTAPESWIAPAEARNGYPSSSFSRSRDLNLALQAVDDGGCQGPRTKADVRDEAAVTASVASARGDTAFYRYLAESMWLDQHPADALLYSTHRMIAVVDPEAPRMSEQWTPALASVMESIDEIEGWTEGPSEGYADFAQGVAVAPGGATVLVRVGDPAVIEGGFVSAVDAPMIECGDVGVLLGSGAFARADAAPPVPYEGLADGVCRVVG
ncbi:MAG: hypothetical protein NVV57_09675 [Demequina sp.]|nr:hypothetical protein [Demequina sp.]